MKALELASMGIRTLSTKGISPSHHLSSLVTSISSTLQYLKNQQDHHPSSSSTSSSFESLNHFSSSLTPNLVIQVIKSHQSDPQIALYFFFWASTQNPNHYSHTPPCYAAITDILISHSLFSTVEKLLSSTRHPVCSDIIISKLIKSYGDRGDIRGAIHWFHRTRTLAMEPSLYSHNALLGVCVRSNRIKLASALFDQIVKPDVSTYTTMIKGYCKLGLVDQAKRVFDEMGLRRCRPNLITYDTILDGFCKRGLMDNAAEIVEKMIASKECLPDTVTFTTLIDGYCKRGELEAAAKCMDEMEKWNCEPNVLTYNSLINGLCLSGKIDEAKKMLTKMRLNGLKGDVATHTSLLKGLCIVGKWKDAANYLKKMYAIGLKPDVKSYGVIVNEYCKKGRTAEAIALLEEMKGRDLVPHVSSFNALLRALVDSRELEKAIVVLKQMPKKGCSPNFLSYSTVICSLCKLKGRMQDVENLVVAMVRKGHRLDTTMYNLMVMGYCENGDVEMALGMFHQMVENGFVISLDGFSVFVEELCENWKASEAEKAFEELCRRCHVANVDSYKRILDSHLCK